jgi:hypothetical protein
VRRRNVSGGGGGRGPVTLQTSPPDVPSSTRPVIPTLRPGRTAPGDPGTRRPKEESVTIIPLPAWAILGE